MSRISSAATADEILMQAAEFVGIEADGAVVIREGSNAIYQLPNEIIARIGKPGSYISAQRELRVSKWLNQSDIPTVRAIKSLPQPVVIEDRPVTWWHLIPSHRPSTPSELGAMLRKLHTLTPPTTFQLPNYQPFAGLDERITAATTIDEGDRSWLLRHMANLQREYGELPPQSALSVIHGDAWQNNLIVPPSGVPTVLDLDKVSLGRPEWDLVQLAVDHTDFHRIKDTEYRAFVDAYGGYDVTDWTGYGLLANIQELRWVAFAVNRSAFTPGASAEAVHRIACLRGLVPKPWRWKAL